MSPHLQRNSHTYMVRDIEVQDIDVRGTAISLIADRPQVHNVWYLGRRPADRSYRVCVNSNKEGETVYSFDGPNAARTFCWMLAYNLKLVMATQRECPLGHGSMIVVKWSKQ